MSRSCRLRLQRKAAVAVLSCALVLSVLPIATRAEDGLGSSAAEIVENDAMTDEDVPVQESDRSDEPTHSEDVAVPEGEEGSDEEVPADQADGTDATQDGPDSPEAQGDAPEAPQDEQPLMPLEEGSDIDDEELVSNVEEGLSKEEEPLEPQASDKPSIRYATHVQNVGWQAEVKDGKVAGTSGRSLRLEALRVKATLPKGVEGGIEYRAQVQNKGWLPWAKDGGTCGTSGSSLRMEAIQVRLYGQAAEEYDVYYRVHLQNYGWMSWASNGALSGSTGRSLRLEAVQIAIVPKGANPPVESPASQSSLSFVDGTALSVSSHVQNVGWQRPVGSGKVSGTTGRSLRVEALRVSLSGARVPGGITGQAHVQNVGWQGWVGNGGTAGTVGRSLRVEAIRFKLTGEAADVWDLYYRVHVQNAGWLAWAKNGETSGSEGFSLRIEAVEFRLVPKGGSAPNGAGSLAVACLKSRGVSYAACATGSEWMKAVHDGATSGTTGKSQTIGGIRAQLSPSEDALSGSLSYDLDVEGGDWAGWKTDGEDLVSEKAPEAIRMKLSGDLSDVYSVWYRVHLSKAGWLGWARDGQVAGTAETGMHIEAYQVVITPKAASAPGTTSNHFLKHPPLSGDSWLDNYVWNMIDSRGWSGYSGLKQSYEFVRNHSYFSMSHWPGGNTNSWSRPFAKEFIKRGGGNCHRFAALQYWFAKALGFDARLMTGQWHGYLGAGDHSWVEITYEGKILVVDAEQGCPSAYPEINWFMIRYKDARLKYYDLSDRRILR